MIHAALEGFKHGASAACWCIGFFGTGMAAAVVAAVVTGVLGGLLGGRKKR